MLWIQCVTIIWTKATRGGRGAETRNRLPRAFPMLTANADAATSWELYQLDESDAFTPRLVEARSESRLVRVGDLSVRPGSSGTVLLQLRYNPYVGKPERPSSPSLRIRPGETAQLRTNGRFAGHYGQHYTEVCFNAAFGGDLDADVFCARTPGKVVDVRADLF